MNQPLTEQDINQALLIEQKAKEEQAKHEKPVLRQALEGPAGKVLQTAAAAPLMLTRLRFVPAKTNTVV